MASGYIIFETDLFIVSYFYKTLLSIVNQWFFGCIHFLVQFMSFVNFWIFFDIFSALCAQLKTMLPAGFFEEQTAREIAYIAKLPLPIARAMIHAEDESVYDGLDDQQILARRLQLAEFIKKFIAEMESKVHENGA